MRHLVVSIVVGLALLVPGIASAQSRPASGTAVPVSTLLPAGSMWGIGTAAPDCPAVSAPPTATRRAPILVGAPGGQDRWCGYWAHLGPSGGVLVPGGIPGAWLSPAQYAHATGQAVTVAYAPDGRVAVYLPS